MANYSTSNIYWYIILSLCLVLLIESSCATLPQAPPPRQNIVNNNIEFSELVPIRLTVAMKNPVVTVRGFCFWDRLNTWPKENWWYFSIYPIRRISEVIFSPFTIPLCTSYKNTFEKDFVKMVQEVNINAVFKDKVTNEINARYHGPNSYNAVDPKSIILLNVNNITYWEKESPKYERRKNDDYYIIINASCTIVNARDNKIIADFDVYRALRHESPWTQIFINNDAYKDQLMIDINSIALDLANCLEKGPCPSINIEN